MLFYSGSIRSMGEVHDGNTVTDYMEQERARGITITSAAVTFNWKNHRFNLIDTPGHIDFTMGVEQTLCALDGGIVILDSSAGVEAQTTTVWTQADRYSIPRLVYVNKMDRADANFNMCLESLESKFDIITLATQLPICNDTGFAGIIDIVSMEQIIFDKNAQGRTIIREKITENKHERVWVIAQQQRRNLTDKLSDIDDTLANFIIEQDTLDNIPAQLIVDSLRRCTIDRKGVPVLLGSSYKNIGVQPLMDAVILYLPSPDRHRKANLYNCFDDNFCARAFKVIHDKQRGPITFLRVYRGKLGKNQKIYNIQREKSEIGGRLYTAYADDYEEIAEVTEGNIGGLAGLKWTVTGDVLTSNASTVEKAKKALEKRKNINADDKVNLFEPANIPEPVFFCSIEPPSLSYQAPLDLALQQLEREDPSLRVTTNDETGQTVLGGMGELHIDIIKERIRTEYNIDVDLGPLQIAYKETIENEIKDTYILQHTIGTTKHDVNVTMSLIPNYHEPAILLFDKIKESASNIAAIHPRVMSAVKLGVPMALSHGPRLGCPVINVAVKLHWLEVKRGTSDTMVSSAVSQCIRKMLEAANVVLLEPVMQLEIVLPEQYSSVVLGDLGRRRTQIMEIFIRGQYKVSKI